MLSKFFVIGNKNIIFRQHFFLGFIFEIPQNRKKFYAKIGSKIKKEIGGKMFFVKYFHCPVKALQIHFVFARAFAFVMNNRSFAKIIVFITVFFKSVRQI